MSQWKNAKTELPPRKEGSEVVSKQYWVYYGIKHGEHQYGTAYYNYSPPYRNKGEWVDFANYGAQPNHYTELPEPPKQQP